MQRVSEVERMNGNGKGQSDSNKLFWRDELIFDNLSVKTK